MHAVYFKSTFKLFQETNKIMSIISVLFYTTLYGEWLQFFSAKVCCNWFDT